MAKPLCTLAPIVGKKNKKRSKLYDLMVDTLKQRPLVNFLYGMSLQEEIRNMIGPSGFNSQGEPRMRELLKVLDLEQLITDYDGLINQVEKKAKELGAVNEYDSINYFDNPEDIIPLVKRFNDENERFKASIKYDLNGYYMEVGIIDAENFNVNSSLEVRENAFNLLNDLFRNADLSTAYSLETRKLYNPFNIYYFMNSLDDFLSTGRMSSAFAQFLLDSFNSLELRNRVLNEFGSEASLIVMEIANNVLDTEATPALKTLVKRFLNKALNKLFNIYDRDVKTEIFAQAKEGVDSTTLNDVPTLSLRDTLKELYSEYYIDKESLDLLNKRVEKRSEVALKALQIMVLRYHILSSLKNVKDKAVERKLRKLNRDINNLKHLVSLLDMFSSISQELKEITSYKHRKFMMLKNNIDAINEYSGVLLNQLDFVLSFEGIVEDAINIRKYLNDIFYEDDRLVEEVIKEAKKLSEKIREVKNGIRGKQFDVVHAFFKIYWGEDTPENLKKRGSNITLEELMNLAVVDIGFFDRLLNAPTLSSDPLFNILADAVRRLRNKRDKILRKYEKEVRSVTKALYDSGSDTQFMYALDDDGYAYKIISDFDYLLFEKDLQEQIDKWEQDKTISKYQLVELKNKWKSEHQQEYTFVYTDDNGEKRELEMMVPSKEYLYDKPLFERLNLTKELQEYYTFMMNKKAQMLAAIGPAANNSLFDVIEITTETTLALLQANNPLDVYKVFKNKFIEMFKQREDDIELGIYGANDISVTSVGVDGKILNRLPLFYTHKLKDRSRVSKDFTKSMLAFLSTSLLYISMDEILDTLLLVRNFMENRQVSKTDGKNKLVDIYHLGRSVFINTAVLKGGETGYGGLLEDFYERVIYNKNVRQENYLGLKVNNKFVKSLLSYNSITGLSLNTLGALNNLLVGKIQMLIEAGLGFGGEFFGMANFMHADGQYWTMMPELLTQANSTVKSSKLHLLMDEFDALDDFYERLMESGYYKSALSKILGNTNLFLLYHLGEHVLHGQTMLAVLDREKIKEVETGKIVPLFKLFYVEKDKNGQGYLKLKEGYVRENGEPITEEYLEHVKDIIKYCNNSMHGAFNSYDRGMWHRYAFGRLVMNFRLWMPAHYARRFHGRYYDPILKEWREGFYVTAFNFVRDLVYNLKDYHRLRIKVLWDELDKGQQYNLRRACAEAILLIGLTVILGLLGPAKDHKHKSGMRHTIYLLSRLLLEIKASSPLSGTGFVTNAMKLLLSPMATISTLLKWTNLFNVFAIGEEIQSGKYAGMDKYVRGVQKSLPFYSLIMNAINLGDEDTLFQLFN